MQINLNIVLGSEIVVDLFEGTLPENSKKIPACGASTGTRKEKKMDCSRTAENKFIIPLVLPLGKFPPYLYKLLEDVYEQVFNHQIRSKVLPKPVMNKEFITNSINILFDLAENDHPKRISYFSYGLKHLSKMVVPKVNAKNLIIKKCEREIKITEEINERSSEKISQKIRLITDLFFIRVLPDRIFLLLVSTLEKTIETSKHSLESFCETLHSVMMRLFSNTNLRIKIDGYFSKIKKIYSSEESSLYEKDLIKKTVLEQVYLQFPAKGGVGFE